MKNITTYRYKLEPNSEQVSVFEQFGGVARMVYNMALEIKLDAYKYHGKSISKGELQKQITELRVEYPFIKEVHSQVLQASIDRLFIAYDNFFSKRAKYPKFRNRHQHNSFTYKQGISYSDTHIFFPKIGNVKYRNSRAIPLTAKIKGAVIKKEQSGWFVSVMFEYEYEPEIRSKRMVIGIDMGVKNFATLSTGEVIENPRTLKKYENKLAIKQRAAARKVKGSNNRKKAVKELGKVHAKIRNTRNDFLQKESTKIVNENQVIVLEDLNISGMTRRCKMKKNSEGKHIPNGQKAKSGLNKSILDAGWGNFGIMVNYKSKREGGQVVVADRFYASSKECSNCHEKNTDLKLSDRVWICKKCGVLHDRDGNASLNLEAVGHTAIACRDQHNTGDNIAPPLSDESS